jgi:signal transduction histidine kinase
MSAGVFSESFNAMSESQLERWMDNHPELISQLLLTGSFMALLIFIAVILAIVITVLSFIGIVRFARTNSISEAFNISAIIAHIRRIGWINYIIALITISVIGYIFGTILNFFSYIPIIGIFVELFLTGIFYVPFILFSARFSALVYNTGEEGSLKSSDATSIPPVSQ